MTSPFFLKKTTDGRIITTTGQSQHPNMLHTRTVNIARVIERKTNEPNLLEVWQHACTNASKHDWLSSLIRHWRAYSVSNFRWHNASRELACSAQRIISSTAHENQQVVIADIRDNSVFRLRQLRWRTRGLSELTANSRNNNSQFLKQHVAISSMT